jgi:hypothetical protein
MAYIYGFFYLNHPWDEECGLKPIWASMDRVQEKWISALIRTAEFTKTTSNCVPKQSHIQVLIRYNVA